MPLCLLGGSGHRICPVPKGRHPEIDEAEFEGGTLVERKGGIVVVVEVEVEM
jgi:hypothetical protein